MPDSNELIRARYLSSVLNVARRADRESAVRLLKALLTEQPRPQTPLGIAKAQRAAISAVTALLAAVHNGTGLKQHWDYALAQADAWHSEVIIEEAPDASSIRGVQTSIVSQHI